MRVVFLGAPGVGKGTQADRIAAQFKIAKISTGDLLREAVRNQTELGREAKRYMDQGQLVPDAVVIGLVRDKLAEPGSANGFVLDGFPRTVPQAEALGKVLQDTQRPLHQVVKFEVPRQDIIRRLSGRRGSATRSGISGAGLSATSTGRDAAFSTARQNAPASG